MLLVSGAVLLVAALGIAVNDNVGAIVDSIVHPACSGNGHPYTADDLSRALTAVNITHDFEAHSAACGGSANDGATTGFTDVFLGTALESGEREFLACFVHERGSPIAVNRSDEEFRYSGEQNGPSYTDVFVTSGNVSCLLRLRTSRPWDTFGDRIERALTLLRHRP